MCERRDVGLFEVDEFWGHVDLLVLLGNGEELPLSRVPIEMAWSKMKARVRAAGARSYTRSC